MKPALNKKTLVLISAVVVLVVVILASAFYLVAGKAKEQDQTSEKIATSSTQQSNPPETKTSEKTAANPPDTTKLPLGDNKVSTSPKIGYVYSCQTSFNGGGAFSAGPWINQATKTWDLSKKVTVDGSKAWTGDVLLRNLTTRTITSNGLPNHTTGNYPINPSDDAYQYDRNPNSIKTQSLSFSFPLNPVLLSTPQCVGGEVGIMLSGVPIFNGFDAGGRDAVAWEVQDTCAGHPQSSGQYHYHGPSKCLKDSSANGEHSVLAGYAFDGFGIFGLKGEGGVEVSTNDLDECHGHTHSINWDGKEGAMYHYHLTNDFPYSVSCFRAAKAVTGPLSSGEGQMGGPQQGGQQKPPPPQ